MGKVRDLTGQKFGRLTALRDSGERDSGRNCLWECQCECGNIAKVSTKNLVRSDGKGIRSCGCLVTEKQKNLLGQQFGKLKVIALSPETKHNKRQWICECECGNRSTVVTRELTRTDGKAIKSCGQCYKIIDETGKRYGHWTVLERDTTKTSPSGCYWLCQCDCGKIVSVLGRGLRSGRSTSCGCRKSKGEELIYSILQSYNIPFKQQISFNDLKSNKNASLYFDFAIYNRKNDLIALIEYQGRQHYEKGFKYTDEDFAEAQDRDELKRQYCIANNIPLIEIKYTDFEIIDIFYILNRIIQKKEELENEFSN